MRVTEILLLKSDSPGDFTSALHELLTSSTCRALRLRVEVVECGADFDPESLARQIVERRPDLCFFTSRPRGLGQAGELLKLVLAQAPHTRVIVGRAEGEPEQMVELLKLGAADFITPPLRAVDILPRVWRWAEGSHRAEGQPRPVARPHYLKQLVGRSEAFLAEVNKIPAIAQCDAGVLITGETGTGKELCARAIHYLSRRAPKPFVPLNCGALPVELVENELFGHARGAYTGASAFESGLVREADGGTLFLDEVDSLPLQAQVKLLRFLQEKEYKPLGTAKLLAADVRVVAAMNTAPAAAVESGKLRRDLYYRLNVVPLRLPPLRQRRDDIPRLARHFLDKYAAEFDKRVSGFTPEAARALAGYDWPGNVRELEHVVERAILFSDGPLINEVDVRSAGDPEQSRHETFREAKAELIKQFEKAYLEDLLLANQGNVSRAARVAHKDRRALWHLIRKHQIDIECFRPGPQAKSHASGRL
jgi:DNA-binding NtrC family response regulator